MQASAVWQSPSFHHSSMTTSWKGLRRHVILCFTAVSSTWPVCYFVVDFTFEKMVSWFIWLVTYLSWHLMFTNLSFYVQLHLKTHLAGYWVIKNTKKFKVKNQPYILSSEQALRQKLISVAHMWSSHKPVCNLLLSFTVNSAQVTLVLILTFALILTLALTITQPLVGAVV